MSSIEPFPELAVEVIVNILSHCDTSTLATVCAASFDLLSLAAPLLYDEVVVSTEGPLILLLCDRVRSLPSSTTAPINSAQTIDFALSGLDGRSRAKTRIDCDRSCP